MSRRDEVDAAILAAIAPEFHAPGGVWPSDRAIWDAACEACAKACEELTANERGETLLASVYYVQACRALKSTGET